MSMISPEDLGGLLFNIHSHADIEESVNPEGIVYCEDDIIKLLKKLGLPEPKWGKDIQIDSYVTDKEKHSNTIEYCASTNTEEYNRLKVLEEIAEFQEVMTKRVTKRADNPSRPKQAELIKEYGDVLYRGLIYLRQQFPDMTLPQLEEEISKHIDKKLLNLEEHRLQKQYKGGL